MFWNSIIATVRCTANDESNGTTAHLPASPTRIRTWKTSFILSNKVPSSSFNCKMSFCRSR